MTSWAEKRVEEDAEGILDELLLIEQERKDRSKVKGRLMSPETRWQREHGYEPQAGYGLDGYPLMPTGGKGHGDTEV